MVMRGQLHRVVVSRPRAEPEDVVGVGPALAIPTLNDDLVFGRRLQTIEHEVAVKGERVAVERVSLVVVVVDRRDDVCPVVFGLVAVVTRIFGSSALLLSVVSRRMVILQRRVKKKGESVFSRRLICNANNGTVRKANGKMHKV